MQRKKWFILLAVGALIVVAIGGYAISRQVPHPVAIGTPIRHDDFLFTVTAVRRSVLKDGAAHYDVGVRVENQAKVVNYAWRDAIAYVRAFDSGGFGHNFYPLGSGSFTLAPGESRVAHLQFEVPAGMSSANLRFWDGIFMGDAFNGGAYARMIVPLEPYHPPFGT